MPTVTTTSIEQARTEVDTWAIELRTLAQRIYPRFRRVEARQRFVLYLKALLAPIERKNAWQLAEQAGDPTPCRMQHLLRSAIWDSDQVRDDLRGYVVEHLGEPDGVLVVDETGFLKQGTNSVGVQRQYSGTAGRTENCQVGVFLTYASALGHPFLDRELYLPKSWTEDPERCRAAGIPKDTEFATKLQLARRMVERAVQAKVPAQWVSADALYGADHRLRRFVEEQGLGYVLAVPSNQSIWVGRCQHRVSGLVAEAPEGDWQQLSCGQGSKGPRLYDWLAVPYEHPDGQTKCRWVLARRNLSEPTDVAYFLASGPAETPLAQLVQVVGKRSLDRDLFCNREGGSRSGSLRSALLEKLVSSHHSVVAGPRLPDSAASEGRPGKKTAALNSGESIRVQGQARALLPITLPEVRRLLWHLVWSEPLPLEHRLHWVFWRRWHQTVAQFFHYKVRAVRLSDDPAL